MNYFSMPSKRRTSTITDLQIWINGWQIKSLMKHIRSLSYVETPSCMMKFRGMPSKQMLIATSNGLPKRQCKNAMKKWKELELPKWMQNKGSSKTQGWVSISK